MISLMLIGCSKPAPDRLIVAVASNTQYAIEEIQLSFAETTGIECDLVVSSSGKLTAQVKEGAPFDLLISADMKYPEELYRLGFTVAKPATYAYGKLVLWTANADHLPSLDDLTASWAKHVAVANPKTAPYGMAAIEVLEKHGIYESVKHKLVFGESISQTNQFILSGAAELGFTAKSVVLSEPMKEQGRWLELDQDQYSPLVQGLVIINNHKAQLSQRFVDFLFSPVGQQILHQYGYEGYEGIEGLKD